MGESKSRVTRKDFVQASLFGLGGLTATVLGLDQAVFEGSMFEILFHAAIDKEFRKKLIDTIMQGRAPGKLKDELYERTIPYIKESGLGKKETLTENSLNQGFRAYEIRRLTQENQESGRLVLIASLGNNIGIVQTVFTEGNKRNITTTQEIDGKFFTLPTANINLNTKGEPTLFFYSAFQIGNNVYSYGQDKKRHTSAALVLLNNGKCLVVDRKQLDSYDVGRNCRAIQSYPLAVNSMTLNHDLNSIGDAQFRHSGDSLQSRIYDCFVVSFFDKKTNKSVTKIISVYQHLNEYTKAISGERWTTGLSIENGVGICKQLMQEGGFDGFTMVVPDPNYLHSRLNGPISLDEVNGKWLLRTFGRDSNPMIDETDEQSHFYAPIFLAAQLGL